MNIYGSKTVPWRTTQATGLHYDSFSCTWIVRVLTKPRFDVRQKFTFSPRALKLRGRVRGGTVPNAVLQSINITLQFSSLADASYIFLKWRKISTTWLTFRELLLGVNDQTIFVAVTTNVSPCGKFEQYFYSRQEINWRPTSRYCLFPSMNVGTRFAFSRVLTLPHSFTSFIYFYKHKGQFKGETKRHKKVAKSLFKEKVTVKGI